MSSHVLLNLLNELGKRDKMRGLPSILSLFRSELLEISCTGSIMCMITTLWLRKIAY